MFSIESPSPGQYYWGGSDARSGNVPYGWSAPMWVPGNVAPGSTLNPDQKTRLGIKIPGDINWSGSSTDQAQLCFSIGFNPGKGSSVSGMIWMLGYQCSDKSTSPLFTAKTEYLVNEARTSVCGVISENFGEVFRACDYVMVVLTTDEATNHSGYLHVSFNLSTWRKYLSGPV